MFTLTRFLLCGLPSGSRSAVDPVRARQPRRSPGLRGALLAILLVLFVVLGIAPLDRETWALENAPFVAGLALLVGTRRWLPLSTGSCMLIFVFLMLHEVGAHYTYSLVPYESWLQQFTGRAVHAAPDPSRNHYDRFVHFSFGLLLAYPMRELFLRTVDARGIASYVLPVQMTLSWSALYELLEWAAASLFGGETGTAYVGMQGDEWDAQKDMLLAGSGAVLAMALSAALHCACGADLQRASLGRRLVPARVGHEDRPAGGRSSSAGP